MYLQICEIFLVEKPRCFIGKYTRYWYSTSSAQCATQVPTKDISMVCVGAHATFSMTWTA